MLSKLHLFPPQYPIMPSTLTEQIHPLLQHVQSSIFIQQIAQLEIKSIKFAQPIFFENNM